MQGVRKAGTLFATSVTLAPQEEEKKLAKRSVDWETRLLSVREPEPLVHAPALFAMENVFRQAALRLESAVVNLQPVLVRFDEDTDGITSALFLRGLVEHFVKKRDLSHAFNPDSHLKAFQAEAPIFEMKHFHFMRDVAEDFAKKPLLVLLDHGGNQESENALKAAKEEGFDLMLVDHHPPWKPSLSLFDLVVHPAQHGGGSELNTGLLMYHVASCVYAAPKDWAYFSMQADRSSWAKKEFFKEGVVLDYVSMQEWPLKRYGELLNDKAKVDSLYDKCLRLREKALEKAVEKRRVKRFGNVTVEYLDLSYLESDYPPKGGVVQGLHEHFENEGPLVTVGYDKERVIFRLNEGGQDGGFAANAAIAELKERQGLVASGGGHARAASMRLKPGKLPAVLELLEQKFSSCFG